MTDKSTFTKDDWKALRDAPMFIGELLLRVGPHNPVSTVHEALAGKKAMKKTDGHGAADGLIAEIAHSAKGQMAQLDGQRAMLHKGEKATESMLASLRAANSVLDTVPPAEAAGVRAWLVDLAKAVPDGTSHPTDAEREMLAQIVDIFR